MSKSKKFSIRIVQDNSSWSAEIVRRVTSKQSVVSKHQTGFATEAEAQQWAQTELTSFLEKLSTRNRQRRNQS